MPHEKPSSAGAGAFRAGAVLALVATPIVGVALAQVTWELGAASVQDLARAMTPSVATVSLGDALAVVAGAAGTLVAAHLTLTAVLLVLAPRSSRLHSTVIRFTPDTWRRIVGTAVAGALSAGLAVPAVATTGTSDAGWVSEQVDHAQAAASTSPTPSPIPTVSAVTTGADIGSQLMSARAASTQGSAREDATPGTGPQSYVVAPGDSLWSITADALGRLGDSPARGSDDTSVAAAWPELYGANRDSIGADPGLIHPGDRLVIPEGWTR